HLSLDLRFAQNHRVETRRDAIEVPHRLALVRDVAILPGTAARDAVEPLTQQRPHGFQCRLVFRDEIKLGAITRGQQHAALRPCRHHARERGGHFVRAMSKALPHFERRGAMIDSEDLDAHAFAVTHKNRSAPGCTSLSATYTSRTAEKPAMLAKAARRPAQWRTTRTQTAQPSTTPSTLSATCRTNHAFRPAEGSAPGASPLRIASPTRPVASGPAKNATAEPRSSRSLASCNRTRHSASIEMAGPRPIGVSCET